MSRISELPFIACKTLRNEPKQNGFHVLAVLIEMWECADDTVHKIRFHRELEDMKIHKRRKNIDIYRIHSMQLVQCRPQHTLRVEAVFKA
jgi:hypothetical protein